MRGNTMENDIVSLNPSNFNSLQFYFSKFKARVLHLKQCGIEKKYEQLVLAIVITDFTTLGRSHFYGLPCPSSDSLDPLSQFIL